MTTMDWLTAILCAFTVAPVIGIMGLAATEAR